MLRPNGGAIAMTLTLGISGPTPPPKKIVTKLGA